MEGLHLPVDGIPDAGDIQNSDGHGDLHIQNGIKAEVETIATETDDTDSNVNLKVLCRYILVS